MTPRYHLSLDGQVHGPYDQATVRDMMTNGLRADVLVIAEGETEWLPLTSHPSFSMPLRQPPIARTTGGEPDMLNNPPRPPSAEAPALDRQSHTPSRTWSRWYLAGGAAMVLACVVAGVVAVSAGRSGGGMDSGIRATSATGGSPTNSAGPSRSAPSNTSRVAEAAPSASNAVAPLVPVLAPEDRDFKDTRGGWGWCDRCFDHMKARHLEWARAACDQAMAMKPNKPQPRASVLFNLGLISELHGDREDARDYFKQSLAVRPNDSVQAELDGLDGKTAATNPAREDAIARCEAARDEVEAILAVLEDAKHRGSGQSKEEAIETMQENVPKLKIARAKWTAAVNAVHDPAIVAEHCNLR